MAREKAIHVMEYRGLRVFLGVCCIISAPGENPVDGKFHMVLPGEMEWRAGELPTGEMLVELMRSAIAQVRAMIDANSPPESIQ